MEKTRKNIKKSSRTKAKPDVKIDKKLKLLGELQGLGKSIWKEDAQKYVNRLRANDRY